MTKIEKEKIPWGEAIKVYIQGVVAAFATYSTLPMPHLDFSSAAISFTLAGFPWVGIVLGMLLSLLLVMCEALGFSALLSAVIFSLASALLTGAIHLDGLADCADAIYSRRGREEELRIMKDPHAGPMALIFLSLYLMTETALIAEWIARSRVHESQIWAQATMIIFLGLSRSLSGRMVLSSPKARPDGMARMVSDPAPEASILILDGLICLWAVLLLFTQSWRVILFALFAYVMYQAFRAFVMKRYQGITGDLAGLFLSLTELGFHFLLVLLV